MFFWNFNSFSSSLQGRVLHVGWFFDPHFFLSRGHTAEKRAQNHVSCVNCCPLLIVNFLLNRRPQNCVKDAQLALPISTKGEYCLYCAETLHKTLYTAIYAIKSVKICLKRRYVKNGRERRRRERKMGVFGRKWGGGVPPPFRQTHMKHWSPNALAHERVSFCAPWDKKGYK